ncbi:PPOX class F420-dependent oxidoreductase [Nonomuraea sp. KC401]|uniref:PPOX class F420-dependent oxidoreductase n=1 Tax=unclassified Nonomuraea TaxID=2593643 RepID=UPI0010FEF61C|nr:MULTISPECIES: PPOX class F420-dependent oxidoreductase [unclassified Nonomuraea]NBE97095.1 PPOX class F420-dependent oxidoreductase [Nonomuraea sp. K271]TLF66157.1 PPOX class F420-dependent oxidoreductase [Nonomuraea sp. KC401]
MSFTEEELAYLQSQPLVRIATVSADGQPDVVTASFELDDGNFYIGGISPQETRRVRNVRAGQRKVALIVDDLVSTDPWTPRFIRVYGTAELVEREGHLGPGHYMKIIPALSWSWNLQGHPVADADADDAGQAPLRRTVHEPTSAHDAAATLPPTPTDTLRAGSPE